MSALDNMIAFAACEDMPITLAEIKQAAADLAALKNDSKWANEYHERLQNLRVMLGCSIDDLPTRISALREAVEQARQLLTDHPHHVDCLCSWCMWRRAWLAAHPASDRAEDRAA